MMNKSQLKKMLLRSVPDGTRRERLVYCMVCGEGVSETEEILRPDNVPGSELFLIACTVSTVTNRLAVYRNANGMRLAIDTTSIYEF